jgi:hypothetical protein
MVGDSLRSTISEGAHSIVFEFHHFRLLEFTQDVVDQDNFEIFTTKVRITICRLHLEDTFLRFQN